MTRAWSGGGSTSDDYGSGFTPERLYGAIQAVGMTGSTCRISA